MKFRLCDYSFICIPNAHENGAIVSRPFPPRAGDGIHPALRKREGTGFETNDQPQLRKLARYIYLNHGGSNLVAVSSRGLNFH